MGLSHNSNLKMTVETPEMVKLKASIYEVTFDMISILLSQEVLARHSAWLHRCARNKSYSHWIMLVLVTS